MTVDRNEWKLLPPDVLAEVARRVFGDGPDDVRRLFVSYSNDVYEVDVGGRTFILRSHRGAVGHFDAERWATEKVAALGCLVPRVLAIEDAEREGVTWSIAIHERLPGVPLLQLTRSSAAVAEHADLLRAVGKHLAAINSIVTSGVGNIDGHGIAPAGELRQHILRHNPDELIERAKTADIDSAVVIAASDILSTEGKLWEPVEPRLIHGDYSSKHILVDDGKLSGVIDFEFCGSDDPARDIAFWDYWEGDWGSTRFLVDGYRLEADVDTEFERRVTMLQVLASLDYISFHVPRDELVGGFRDHVRGRLGTDVAAAVASRA